MHRRTLLRLAAGASVAGLAGCGDGASDAPGTEPTPTESTPTPTSTPTDTPTPTPAELDADHVVEVGPGSFVFEPATLEIAAGETVGWIWRSGGHNIVVDSAPDASTWEGTEGGSGTTYGTGHTHTHTFEVAGQYDYFCAPHRSAGMVGSLTVSE